MARVLFEVCRIYRENLFSYSKQNLMEPVTLSWRFIYFVIGFWSIGNMKKKTDWLWYTKPLSATPFPLTRTSVAGGPACIHLYCSLLLSIQCSSLLWNLLLCVFYKYRWELSFIECQVRTTDVPKNALKQLVYNIYHTLSAFVIHGKEKRNNEARQGREEEREGGNGGW